MLHNETGRKPQLPEMVGPLGSRSDELTSASLGDKRFNPLILVTFIISSCIFDSQASRPEKDKKSLPPIQMKSNHAYGQRIVTKIGTSLFQWL